MRAEEWIKASNEQTPEPSDGWDTPSAQVWAGINDALLQRKRRRVVFWWRLGAGIGVLALLAWFRTEQLPGNDPLTAPGKKAIATATAPATVVADNCIEGVAFIRTPHKPAAITNAGPQPILAPVEATATALPSQLPAQSFDETKQSATIVEHPDLALLDLPEKNRLFAPANDDIPAIPLVRSSNIRGWISIMGVYPWQANLLSGPSAGPEQTEWRETLHRHSDWGLRAGIDRGRWRWFAGFGVYRLDLHTSSTIRVLYDPQQERPGADNTIESTYALSVPSGYGQIDCEIDFFRSADRPVAPGRAVPVRIDNWQQLQMLQAPLGVNYRLGQRRALSARFGCGLAVNWVVGRDANISAVSRLDDLSLRRIRRPAASGSKASARHLSGWLEASAGWAPHPAFELSLSASIHRTLTPLAVYRDGSSLAGHAAIGLGVVFKL